MGEKREFELERQKTKLLRSIARAQNLIERMENIGENESDQIQQFIAYSIPRCNLLFKKRQTFRSVLKDLSIGKIEKKQAIEGIIKLKDDLESLDTVLGGEQ